MTILESRMKAKIDGQFVLRNENFLMNLNIYVSFLIKGGK